MKLMMEAADAGDVDAVERQLTPALLIDGALDFEQKRSRPLIKTIFSLPRSRTKWRRLEKLIHKLSTPRRSC
jgi:hypothetical protein